jgi:rubredoxin
MKFCPNCGSKNIDWVLPQTWSKYECKDCGYIGVFVIEDGKISEKIREEYLKNLKNISNEG